MTDHWYKYLENAREQIRKYSVSSEAVIYTVIFGDYDVIRKPYIIKGTFDYYYITDNKTDNIPKPWRVIRINHQDQDISRLNRLFKFFPHLFLDNYQYSLYIDGNITLIKNPTDILHKVLINFPMACISHPERSCAYEEAIQCVAKTKDANDIIEKQMNRYKKECFPENYGLTQNGVIFRNHFNPNLARLMESWWTELCLESKRDQLALSYVSWKTGIHINIISPSTILARKKIMKESYFYYFRHKSSKLTTIKMFIKFFFRLLSAIVKRKQSILSLLILLGCNMPAIHLNNYKTLKEYNE